MVFSPWHHAVMFGLLAKGICDHFGEAADGLLLSAVEAYGQERGQRMAARCLRSGDPIDDMASYFAYCEWSWPGSVKTPPEPGCPYVSYRILACPWHSAWKESGLAEYGYFYCRCVDRAILRGFNPALTLSLPTCLTRNERQGCAFHWESAENTPALFDRQRRLEKRLGGTQVRPPRRTPRTPLPRAMARRRSALSGRPPGRILRSSNHAPSATAEGEKGCRHMAGSNDHAGVSYFFK